MAQQTTAARNICCSHWTHSESHQYDYSTSANADVISNIFFIPALIPTSSCRLNSLCEGCEIHQDSPWKCANWNKGLVPTPWLHIHAKYTLIPAWEGVCMSASHLRSWQQSACCPFYCWSVGHKTNTAGLWSWAPPWDREDLRRPCAPRWPSDIVSRLGQACMAVHTCDLLFNIMATVICTILAGFGAVLFSFLKNLKTQLRPYEWGMSCCGKKWKHLLSSNNKNKLRDSLYKRVFSELN